jgi:hypothetical protein
MRLSEKRMDKIKILILFALFLLLSLDIQSQVGSPKPKARRMIYLDSAEYGYVMRDRTTGKDWQRLIGKVKLKHQEITMKCDSAHLFPDKNQVTAYSRIHIVITLNMMELHQ